MNQHDLNRAIANATGEPVALIAGLGFSLLTLPPEHLFQFKARRRTYPLRLAHQARKSRPRRPQTKKSKTVVQPIVKHSGAAS